MFFRKVVDLDDEIGMFVLLSENQPEGVLDVDLNAATDSTLIFSHEGIILNDHSLLVHHEFYVLDNFELWSSQLRIFNLQSLELFVLVFQVQIYHRHAELIEIGFGRSVVNLLLLLSFDYPIHHIKHHLLFVWIFFFFCAQYVNHICALSIVEELLLCFIRKNWRNVVPKFDKNALFFLVLWICDLILLTLKRGWRHLDLFSFEPHEEIVSSVVLNDLDLTETLWGLSGKCLNHVRSFGFLSINNSLSKP